jgi:N-acetylmuramic acid 6-phosphate etherase
MVNVQPTNHKLADRARRIISTITGASYDEAAHLLNEGGSVRTAIVMRTLNLTRREAEARLNAANGRLRIALGENETESWINFK